MMNLGLVILLLFQPWFVYLHQACNHLDRDSLLSLNFIVSSNSPSLNWSSSIDCCLWEGIKCDASGRVSHLCLPFRGLTGRISPFIGNLTHLSHLDLSHNRLSGFLPVSSFSSLNLLEALDLSYNSFSGEFPSTFFQLAEKLISFNISRNSFTGHIPSFVRKNDSLCSLTILDFSDNDFVGRVPPGLGNCSKLQTFRAGFNFLSGSLPDDIFAATSLEEISLPVNQLSRGISNSVVNLTSLSILELYSNKFNGLIPRDIGKLTNLKILLLHTNNFSGFLPQSMMNCSNLFTLNLRVNELKGNLLAYNFSKLLHLDTLDLGNNFFTGGFPLTLTSLKKLTAVRLSANQLEGQISPEIVAVQSLNYLSITNNKFTNITGAIRILMGLKNLRYLLLCKNFFNEEIPDENQITIVSDEFQNLEVLGIGDCEIKGQVPAWLGKLRKLQILDLGSNQLIGSIPGWLGNLQNLFYIDLSYNHFSGEFPEEFCRMPALALQEAKNKADGSNLQLPLFVPKTKIATYNQQYNKLFSLPPAIYLRNNRLTGSIPAEIGRLNFLLILDLSLNKFSGEIPDQISQLKNLEGLDLSGNRLHGEIPRSLIRLNFLSSFSVADNDLRGPIPAAGQFQTFPSSSFEGNPGLCGDTVQHSCTIQPRIDDPALLDQSSENKEVRYGLIAGVVFGFIIGSVGGMICPLHRLKFWPHTRSETDNE
ncbi:Leucine-rich receptor-like protein kinase family protein [Melia azedarach]|uniref:Leucine-rich receptor-like protein kinase family protein n=1 Tax=Melia azedarach TaxID=155640 RepID=A0ACC1Y470_MELAZ|nr:Leucine-rich receptor-like protein kinase family protein [Melia azedarach]